jgi:protein-L-isoaspartate(D-aspartate) O-methyltransferase
MAAPQPPPEKMMFQLTLRRRGISDQAVLRTMEEVPREAFVEKGDAAYAYRDSALGIECGQTISQPFVVAYMTEQLGVQRQHRVLEIGTGSGYQAAVLAELGADVVTIERISELAEQARASLAAAGYPQVEVLVGDGTLGVPDRAPFDAIAVAAAAPAFPETLYEQLRERGRLAVPVGGQRAQRLEVIVRSPEGPAVVHSVPCRFVPLVGKEGFAG